MVVPSRAESFGLVAAEAQACGTPVVAAKVGGLVYVVDDGVTGILVDGWNPADYAEVLDRLLSDDGLRKKMSEAAVVWAKRFSWDATVRRYLELYKGVLIRWMSGRLPCSQRWSRSWVADPDSDVVYAEKVEGRLAVRMRQQVREATTVWFWVGDRSLIAEAYVIPAPASAEAAYRQALVRNGRSFRVNFALDHEGALVLRARMPLERRHCHRAQLPAR